MSVTRSGWVRYHVENYFHELYIFQNRVKALFVLLRRSYRKQEYSASLNAECGRLERALERGFAGVIKAAVAMRTTADSMTLA